ncbi:hypothetical protein PA10_00257 [Pseudomonas phage pPa_SNUABM_DT01]|nr:hypothetical protein PA10_00257 [Pseudomonas phage pPa_SNUABM_DT01]
MSVALPKFTEPLEEIHYLKAFSNFDTRQIGKRQYMMLEEFSFDDEVFGKITVPKGFVTNYASLDALRNIVLFPVYALLADYGDMSATIHDYLYSKGSRITVNGELVRPTKEQADEIFYRALRSEGIARWRAGMFFYGVHLFAEDAYEED